MFPIIRKYLLFWIIAFYSFQPLIILFNGFRPWLLSAVSGEDCMVTVKSLPALHHSVDFIF